MKKASKAETKRAQRWVHAWSKAARHGQLSWHEKMASLPTSDMFQASDAADKARKTTQHMHGTADAAVHRVAADHMHGRPLTAAERRQRVEAGRASALKRKGR